MDKETYAILEAFMLEHMRDSAHDAQHVYRVLSSALDIAKHETAKKNEDVLIAACLLHDIGRGKQFEDKSVCHAQAGGEMAYEYLIAVGWDEAKSAHVQSCIATHRFRGDNPPTTIEAKILFDSDKLDAAGAVGIARTLIYKGHENTGLDDFFLEYEFKLSKIYNNFHTARARELANSRKWTAIDFYAALKSETQIADIEDYLNLRSNQ